MKKNLAVTSRTTAKHDKEENCNDDDGLSSLSLDPIHGISGITLDDLDQELFESDMGVEAPSAAVARGEPQIENYDRAAIGERVEPDGTALAMNVDGAVSSLAENASRAEKNEMLLDRELEGGGTEADELGDLWRWLWDVEDSSMELQVEGMEEGCDQHQVEYMASWLLSDVF
ncbi:myb-related protein P-like [Iris pallida]|uniref:Myb-related protein P-like n=1 Tax=Iris pallida TaxID=29817 RepID=A0AAX6I9M7_IRIPA|nr:myb-related protein P-like [Iris pallida]